MSEKYTSISISQKVPNEYDWNYIIGDDGYIYVEKFDDISIKFIGELKLDKGEILKFEADTFFTKPFSEFKF